MESLSRNRRGRGFSLIEIVVVVALLAILAMIAFPTYQSAIRKSRRTEGKILLQSVMAAEERYYSRTNRYTGAVAELGLGGSVESEPGKYYLLAQVNLADEGQRVAVTAAPRGAQLADVCANLTLDSLGHRTASGPAANGSECW